MKCAICQKNTIDLKAKLPLILGINIKCRNCDARYKKSRFLKESNIFMKFFGWVFNFILDILWLPVFILVVWAIYTLSFWAPVLGVVSLIIFARYLPYEIDKSDPANKIIERVNKND